MTGINVFLIKNVLLICHRLKKCLLKVKELDQDDRQNNFVLEKRTSGCFLTYSNKV